MKANVQKPCIFTHVNFVKHLDIRSATKQHRAVEEYTDLCTDSSYSKDEFLNWGNPSFLPAGNHDNCELLQETLRHQDRVLRTLCGVFSEGSSDDLLSLIRTVSGPSFQGVLSNVHK